MSLLGIFVVTCMIAFFAYYFNATLPDGVSEPWKLKIILAGYKLANLLSTAGEKLGYDTKLNISRVLFGTAFKFTSQYVPSTGLVIEDRLISDVPVRVYHQQQIKENAPVLIYFHGGGTILFSLDTYENILREISRQVNAIIISVGYRLAPEHKYPAAIDDCYKVTLHVLQNAMHYGGDCNRVTIAGDSAGGNMAASVSWRLAYDTSSSSLATTPLPKRQVLLYPMLQAFDFQLPSYVEQKHDITRKEVISSAWYTYCTGDVAAPVQELLANNHTSYTMKTSQMAKYVDPWLIEHPKYKKNRTPNSVKYNQDLARKLSSCVTKPDFSPLLAEDVSRFPPTYIMSAEHDILRDENFIFESRLKSAGVNVTHEHIIGGWHGVACYTKTKLGQQVLRQLIAYLKTNM